MLVRVRKRGYSEVRVECDSIQLSVAIESFKNSRQALGHVPQPCIEQSR